MNDSTSKHTDKVRSLRVLEDRILVCRKCPRLVAHREEVARIKRRSYVEWCYWGKPVPSLGGNGALLLIVGLAPGAHGANRTGRIFTGDSSGDLLYRTLYCFGFCNQPDSRHLEDGMEMRDAYITAVLHCVPPQNKPLTEEVRTCRQYLIQELALLRHVKVVVALGGIAWKAYLDSWSELGGQLTKPRPKFGHGIEVTLDDTTLLIGSYHPSRQNTQTGRLTVEMFESVFRRANQILQTSLNWRPNNDQ